MWTKTHSAIYPDVAKESVWRLWADVNRWTAWHGDLEFCKLEEPFAAGSHFLLKPKGAPKVKIEITEMKEGSSFTDRTPFPGASLYSAHELEETPEGLRVTNTLTVKGPLSLLWTKLVAEKMARTLARENDALIQLARSQK